MPYPPSSIAEEIELATPELAPADDQDQHPPLPPLPRADGGRQAWTYLAGAFLVEAMIWGLPASYSIFQEYYIREGGPFEGQQGLITLTGTLSSGLIYMSGLLVYPALERKPHWRRKCMWVGFVIMVAGLVGSGFAKSASSIVVTQGLLFALGGSILYAPVITWMNEWFLQRRGFAYGVISAGTSVSGIVFPFIIQSLLSRYGFRVTLWSLGAAMLLLIGPLLPFIQGRLPVEEGREEDGVKKYDYSFVKSGAFWLLWLCVAVQAIGFFLPSLFVPIYAQRIAPGNETLGSTCIVALNAAAVVSRLVFGALSDSPRLTLPLILFSTISSALSVLLIWGLAASSIQALIGFSVAYGICSGGFSSLFGGMAKRVGHGGSAQSSNLYGLFSFGRGLGNVLSAPISTALLSSSPLPQSYGLGTYGPLIVFTGVSLAGAGLLGGLSAAGRGKGRKVL